MGPGGRGGGGQEQSKNAVLCGMKERNAMLTLLYAALPYDADAVGPAVSIDGYPRYSPQWGVGLPEKKKVMPATPIRREPSERAKAVMTRPGTPPYPKAPSGGYESGIKSSRAEPSGEAYTSSYNFVA